MSEPSNNNEPNLNNAPSGTEPWINSLPENLRSNPGISRYSTLEQFAQAKIHLDKHFGVPAEQIIKLPNYDDAEGLSQLYSKLGRPETADKYEFGVPDGVAFDENRAKALKDEFHKLGLSQKQAEGIMNTYKGFVESDIENMNNQSAAEIAAGELQLRNQWGKQYDEILAQTQDYMKKNVDDKTMDMLEKHGLDKIPALIQVVGNLVRQVNGLSSGGALPGGVSPSKQSLTPNDAKAQIEQLSVDKQFISALQNAKDPGHQSAIEKWKNLHQILVSG